VQKKDIRKRLDKFLSGLGKTDKKFSGFSRGDFTREIKAGRILVNGLKIKPGYRLCVGDEINLDNVRKTEEKLFPNSKIELEIIYEDKNIIAVNKPAGLQVHPDYNEKLNTVVNKVISRYPEISSITEDSSALSRMRPGIVHRLDKDTSGILAIARNKKTFDELKRMFKAKEVLKKYLAIVYGAPEEKTGIINKPLARTSNYRRQTIAGKKTKTKIREAITEYKLVKKLNNGLSLLEISPKTGRTHQIRVHLFSIGHPIVGDKLYKLKSQIANRKSHNADRQMLHASEIRFELLGKKYHFSAKPPEDFKSFLK
jgi:23S rRNA pseudouridine1911/1915/1917 synthase